MNKRYIFLLIIIALVFVPSKQKNVLALTCAEQVNYVARIVDFQQSLFSASPYFQTEDIILLDKSVEVSSPDTYRHVYNEYTKNMFGEEDIASGELYNVDALNRTASKFYPPEFLIEKIDQGDIVVAGGLHNYEDCMRNGVYSFFNSDDELKYMYFQGHAYDDHIPFLGGRPSVIGDEMTNTQVLFTQKLDGDAFILREGESKEVAGLTLDLLSINNVNLESDTLDMNKSASISFVLSFNAGKVPTLNVDTMEEGTLCNISQYSTLIIYGKVGDDVKQVQQCLNSIGSTTGEIDGIYGENTYKGIIDFQTKNGIKIDGIIGPQTVEYLNSL